jgi:3-hydroxy-3-methylglutaryl CoA synthase
MAYPKTLAEINARLDTLQDLIDTYTASPSKYYEVNDGSVKVSLPEYLRALRDEQNDLQTRKQKLPYLVGSMNINTLSGGY